VGASADPDGDAVTAGDTEKGLVGGVVIGRSFLAFGEGLEK
jgi:hypothetical protein